MSCYRCIRRQCPDCRDHVSNSRKWIHQLKFLNLDLNRNHCHYNHSHCNRLNWNFHHYRNPWILLFLLVCPHSTSNDIATRSSTESWTKSNSLVTLGLVPVINAKPDVEYPNVKAKTIAFGSCHKNSFVDETRGIIWDAISELRPDVFLWTGELTFVIPVYPYVVV